MLLSCDLYFAKLGLPKKPNTNKKISNDKANITFFSAKAAPFEP
jgi:hypothetical protein